MIFSPSGSVFVVDFGSISRSGFGPACFQKVYTTILDTQLNCYWPQKKHVSTPEYMTNQLSKYTVKGLFVGLKPIFPPFPLYAIFYPPHDMLKLTPHAPFWALFISFAFILSFQLQFPLYLVSFFFHIFLFILFPFSNFPLNDIDRYFCPSPEEGIVFSTHIPVHSVSIFES